MNANYVIGNVSMVFLMQKDKVEITEKLNKYGIGTIDRANVPVELYFDIKNGEKVIGNCRIFMNSFVSPVKVGDVSGNRFIFEPINGCVEKDKTSDHKNKLDLEHENKLECEKEVHNNHEEKPDLFLENLIKFAHQNAFQNQTLKPTPTSKVGHEKKDEPHRGFDE